MGTNIVFKSNLYVLLEHIAENTDRPENSICPYNDRRFVEKVFDPEKLNKIIKMTIMRDALKYSPCFQVQQKYIGASAICCKSKKFFKNQKSENYPQYWIFRYSEDKDGNKELRDTCKCPFTQCDLFDACRPGQKEQAIAEVDIRKTLKEVNRTKPIKGYPVISNLNRVFERYDSKAYALIANQDIKQRLTEIESCIKRLDYDGNPNWENFDLGTTDRNFGSGKLSEKDNTIPLNTSLEKHPNPMIQLQRMNKNR